MNEPEQSGCHARFRMVGQVSDHVVVVDYVGRRGCIWVKVAQAMTRVGGEREGVLSELSDM